MKKILSLCLCLLIIFNIFPVKTFAEEQNLEEIIRPQIEAFAKSIDQKNADGAAQDALISHGIKGNGKKLSVGKSHALTATIMNSELVREYLTVVCSELVNATKELEKKDLYGLGNVTWKIKTDSYYFCVFYDYNISLKDLENEDPHTDFKRIEKKSFKPKNSYDKTLEVIAGGTGTDIDLKTKEVREDKVVYEVSVVLYDLFDFSTDNGSALEDLLGWVGLLLFEPYEWESKFSFQIEIPIEKPEENIVFGDSDGNGKVDVADAYFARLVAAKLVKPTEEQLAFCDVDSDGKITAIDANIIRKFAAGIIKELPVS